MNRENTIETPTPFAGIALPAQQAADGVINGFAGAREVLQRWILAARIARLAARITRVRSRTIRELQALSDSTLDDIGIPRSHIASTVDALIREKFSQN